MNNKRILLVDDETQLTRVLKRSLAAHRFDVRSAADGDSAMDLFNDWSPDLVITDLSMPEMSGIELCRNLRKKSQVPIIILSVKGEEKTKIEALDAGADDYVTKPFGIDELLARIRATLRRTSQTSTAAESEKAINLEAGDFFINAETRQVVVRGAEIRLTPKEFELLAFLMKNHGKVLTHRTILGAIWGENFTGQTEYLRVFMGHLRKKIEPNPSEPQYILTEPWVGYSFKP